MPLFSKEKSPVILGMSSGSVSHTGTTAETAKASLTIPGGIMGTRGMLRFWFVGSLPNNANLKTWSVRLGGVGGTIFGGIPLTSGYLSYAEQKIIANANSASSQIAYPAGGNIGLGVSTGAVATGAVNTGIDQEFVITCKLASAADTMTIDAWVVELLRT